MNFNDTCVCFSAFFLMLTNHVNWHSLRKLQQRNLDKLLIESYRPERLKDAVLHLKCGYGQQHYFFASVFRYEPLCSTANCEKAQLIRCLHSLSKHCLGNDRLQCHASGCYGQHHTFCPVTCGACFENVHHS